MILACTVVIGLHGVTDGRTDRQTDQRLVDSYVAQHYMLSRTETEGCRHSQFKQQTAGYYLLVGLYL